MEQNNSYEQLLFKGINCIRKEKRKRPNFEEIFTYMHDFDEFITRDFVTDLIANLINKDKIFKSGKKQSYYVRSQDAENDISVTSVNTLNESNVKVEENNLCMKEINSYIVKTVNDRIKPFIDKISYLLEKHDHLIKEHQVLENRNRDLHAEIEKNDLNVKKIPESIKNVNDVLMKSLNDEISFLRKEIESKDVIIKMLLDERCQTTKDKVNKDVICNNKRDAKSNAKNSEANKKVNKLKVTELNKLSDGTEDAKFIEVKKKSAKSKKRQITVIGDSLIKNIEAHKMKRCMKPNEKIYVKSFSGAKIADMRDYAKPSQRYNPDLFILHMGSNDLHSIKTPEEISDEIINVALEIKTDENEIVVSEIICRNDEHNQKGLKVNDFLKIKCAKYALGFIRNSNILVDKHLNGSGLHLNQQGTVALANNFLKIINV